VAQKEKAHLHTAYAVWFQKFMCVHRLKQRNSKKIEVRPMAIYHLTVKIISRGSGRSSVGAAAYRAGEKLHNEYDGTTHDYTNRRNTIGAAAYRAGGRLRGDDGKIRDFSVKSGIVYDEIMLPENAPKAYLDRETLWNAVEKSEKQSNAQTAREVEIALPNELNFDQQLKLVRYFIRQNFVNEGMIADFSFHSGHKDVGHNYEMELGDDPIPKDNPHVHILLTVRPINDDGTWGAKSKKEYILDRNGNRIRTKSGEWKSRKVNATNWDDVGTLLKWRESWAKSVNMVFEHFGIDERIDHRTLKAQGIDRVPTVHIGVAAKQMEKRGISSERGQENREILQENLELIRIDNMLKELERVRQRILAEANKEFEKKMAEVTREEQQIQREFTAELDRMWEQQVLSANPNNIGIFDSGERSIDSKNERQSIRTALRRPRPENERPDRERPSYEDIRPSRERPERGRDEKVFVRVR